MQNILAVYEGDALTNLLDEDRARLFRQRKLVIDYALKQFAAVDAAVFVNNKVIIIFSFTTTSLINF